MTEADKNGERKNNEGEKEKEEKEEEVELPIDYTTDFELAQETAREAEELEEFESEIIARYKEEKLNEQIEEFLEKPKFMEQFSYLQSEEKNSLIINFEDLFNYIGTLSTRLLENPKVFLKYFQQVLYELDKRKQWGYFHETKYFSVRISNYVNRKEVSKIRVGLNNQFITFRGIVQRQSEIRPYVVNFYMRCSKCKTFRYTTYPVADCLRCDNLPKMVPISDKHIFTDSVIIMVQELNEDLKGALPKAVKCVVLGDLVDEIKAGGKITITGFVALQEIRNKLNDFLKYSVVVNVNNVEPIASNDLKLSLEETQVTQEDEKEILEFKKLSQQERLDILTNSYAPSIYGHNDVKTTLLLSLIGAGKIYVEGVPIRDRIHVLLIGDPSCVLKDSNIILSNGQIITIDKFENFDFEKQKIKVYTGQNTKGIGNVIQFVKYKKQPVIEIILESGKRITGTYNHPLRTFNKKTREYEWKRLDELKIEDKLKVTTKIYCTFDNEIETEFKSIKGINNGNKNYKLPVNVNEDLAALMGYIIGDGSNDGQYKIRYSIQENELEFLESKLNNICVSLFDYIPKKQIIVNTSHILIGHNHQRHLIIPKYNKCYDYYIYSNEICTNLSFLKDRRIPQLIFKSSDRIISVFLKWLFQADGTVYNNGRNKGGISYKSINLDLLLDIQLILLRFGIHSRIIENQLTIRRGESIQKFYNHIGFIDNKKNKKLKQLSDDAKIFERRGKQILEKIISIEYKKEFHDVYDIVVDKYHSFIANGIVSHNTAKTQLLKFGELITVGSFYASGSGTTATGLTAAAIKEPDGTFALQPGYLIFANGTTLWFDEVDKVKPEVLGHLHQSMEDGLVSLAKGGTIATLNANTTIVSAMNPKGSRYDEQLPVIENIDTKNIPDSFLTRFDFIFIIIDKIDKELDRKVSQHIDSIVVDRVIPTYGINIMSTVKLRKYIEYVKLKNIDPTFSKSALQKLEDYYIAKRQKSTPDTIAISPRMKQGMLRSCRSVARLLLDRMVGDFHADMVIGLMDRLFESILKDEDGNYNVQQLVGKTGGKLRGTRALYEICKRLIKDEDYPINRLPKTKVIMILTQEYKFTEKKAHELIDVAISQGIIRTPLEGKLEYLHEL